MRSARSLCRLTGRFPLSKLLKTGAAADAWRQTSQKRIPNKPSNKSRCSESEHCTFIIARPHQIVLCASNTYVKPRRAAGAVVSWIVFCSTWREMTHLDALARYYRRSTLKRSKVCTAAPQRRRTFHLLSFQLLDPPRAYSSCTRVRQRRDDAIIYNCNAPHIV